MKLSKRIQKALRERRVTLREIPYANLQAWARQVERMEKTLGFYGDSQSLAQEFHSNYEALAPEFGYKTREASAVEWAAVPEQNRKLMVAVAEIIGQYAQEALEKTNDTDV